MIAERDHAHSQRGKVQTKVPPDVERVPTIATAPCFYCESRGPCRHRPARFFQD